MFFKDIESVFTQKVAEYMQKGYSFNCETMSGSQGEIARVDLRMGDDIVRIMLVTSFTAGSLNNMVTLIVGRNTDKRIVSHHGYFYTMWNKDLDIIEKVEFYEVGASRNGSKYYTTSKKELAECFKKKHDRLLKSRTAPNTIRLNKIACQIVLPFVKRQKGLKTCKITDISSVVKRHNKFGVKYMIHVKDRVIELH